MRQRSCATSETARLGHIAGQHTYIRKETGTWDLKFKETIGKLSGSVPKRLSGISIRTSQAAYLYSSFHFGDAMLLLITSTWCLARFVLEFPRQARGFRELQGPMTKPIHTTL